MMNKNLAMLPAAPDTVGAIMSREPLVLSPLMRAREALARLRQVGIPKDFMTNCYVVDEDGILVGLFTVRDLIMAPDHKRLDQFMSPPAEELRPEDDQELAVSRMDQLDLVELPVIDGVGHLVGTVTADDAMDVLQDEATEDMEKMAAMLPSARPYLETRVVDLYRSRVLWLLLLMVSATLTGLVITRFENALAYLPCLTAFIPMLMDTGSNSGSQACVSIIRGISLNEIQFRDIGRVVWKEIRVSVLCGICLAVACFAKIVLVDMLLLKSESVTYMVAFVVCVTMAVTVCLAKMVGSTLPLLAKKLGFDPAVMASPIITTIVDFLSLLVYFAFATSILPI